MYGVARVVLLGSALWCVAACSGEESEQYLVEASGLGTGTQRIRVSRDGKGVTQARVTVGGALAAHESDGTYVVPQPAAMPAGSRVDLLVVAGEDTLQGQAVVPATPSITAPAVDSLVAHTADVNVEWTFEGSADGFSVVVTASNSVKTFDAGPADRSLVVASRDLPSDGEVTVEVFALARGVLAGPVAADSLFSVRSNATNAVAFRRSRPLQVRGSDMSDRWQNVLVMSDANVVTDAVVTINGQVAPIRATTSIYTTELQTTLAVGAELRMVVARGGVQFGVATGKVAEVPQLTAPADGASFSAAAPVTVTWTSGTNPDRFTVVASWSCGTGCGTGKWFDAASTARTFDIPAGELPTNTDVSLSVFAYNDGTFEGLFTPDSRMSIRSEGESADGVRVTAP